MAGATFVFENAGEIKKLFADAPITAVDACRRELKKIGRDIINRARNDHRFLTQSGNLERSMRTKTLEGTAGGSGRASAEMYVEADLGVAPYARRIHYGWGTWMPDRYLGDAFWEMAKGEYGPSMGDRLESAIRKAMAKMLGRQ